MAKFLTLQNPENLYPENLKITKYRSISPKGLDMYQEFQGLFRKCLEFFSFFAQTETLILLPFYLHPTFFHIIILSLFLSIKTILKQYLD